MVTIDIQHSDKTVTTLECNFAGKTFDDMFLANVAFPCTMIGLATVFSDIEQITLHEVLKDTVYTDYTLLSGMDLKKNGIWVTVRKEE